MTDDRTRVVRRLSASEIWEFPGNSRLVSLRWDLIPFGLVVDCDVPASEEEDAPMHRGWLVFEHVTDISLPLSQSRLPTGIWHHGGVAEYTVGDHLKEYVLAVLCPTFDGSDKMVGNPNKELRIQAAGIKAVLSRASAQPEENGLPYSARMKLADDVALLDGLNVDAAG